MDIRQNLAALQEMAKYRAAAKLLRANAWGSVIFGVIALFLGIFSLDQSILNLGLAAIGLFLLAGALTTFIKPGPAALMLSGIGLLLVGMWNIGLVVLETKAGGKPSTFWGVLGAMQIWWGIRMFSPKAKEAAISLAAPPSEVMQELDALAASIRKAREKGSPDIAEIVTTKHPPMALRVKLAQGVAFFVDATGTHIYAGEPADVDLTLKKPEAMKDKNNKGELRIRQDVFPCQVSKISYERLIAWKSGIVASSAAPPPPVPPLA